MTPLRLLACALFLLFTGSALAREGPRVAAAADLKFALDEVAQAYARESGRAVRVSYGSSGNFHRQIAQGAPFELFLSADEAYVFELARAGRLESEGVLYAIGRLVLFAPHASPVRPADGLAGLAKLAQAGKLSKVAIANPAHAPYGRAAREALQSAGAWEAVQPRLVLGENVAQAAQFAITGNASAGLFAYALTFSPEVSSKGRFALIPEDAHAPLKQRMALVRGASEGARDFYRYLQTPGARSIFSRHGFGLPERL